MKRILKFLLCLLVIGQVTSIDVYAASFNVSSSTSTVSPGETFTVYIGGECIGRVNVSVSNGVASTDRVWIEENTQSVTITAGSSGTVTVSADPDGGILSTPEAEEYAPGSRSVSVSIVEPEPEPEPEPEKPSTNTESSNNTSTNQPTNNNTTTNNSSNNDASTARPEETEDVEKEKIVEEKKISIEGAIISEIEEQIYTGEPIIPEFVVTLEDKELVEGTDYTIEIVNNVEAGTATMTVTGIGDYEGAVATTFDIVEPIIVIEKGCDIHFITVIVSLAVAFAIFVLAKKQMLSYLLAVIGTIIVIALTMTSGSCTLDWPVAIIGSLAMIGEAFFLNKKK